MFKEEQSRGMPIQEQSRGILKQGQSRGILKLEQSDQDLHCLPFYTELYQASSKRNF